MLISKSKRIINYLQGNLCYAIIICAMGISSLTAQNSINSPYSMFGPGEVRGNSYFGNMGMGGLAQGYRSNTRVNFINPASYTAIDSLSFIFEGVVFSHFYHQQSGDQNQITNYSTLGNFNFGFPITRWLAMAAGILPYSQLGYNIREYSDTEFGRVNYNYTGRGGINQVYLGTGLRILPNLSLGVNANYMFGNATDETIVSSDTIGFYTSIWNTIDEIDGLMLNYGIQWNHRFAEHRNLTLGASYTHTTPLQLRQTRTLSRELAGLFLDTLSHVSGETGTMELPAKFGIGAFMQFNRRWSAGLDYENQAWSNFETMNQQLNLNDSYHLRLGLVHNPRIETYSSVFNRLEYRAGVRYGRSFVNYQNEDFNEYGISFGIGIPLRRSLSSLNIALEYASHQANTNAILKENYYRVNIGLNIYERWFMRRRFY